MIRQVLHQAILFKLLKAGANGNFYRIIESMYLDTKLCANLGNGKRTDFFQSNVGIRQGDNLSPNLFKLIMNDLPIELENITCSPIDLKVYDSFAPRLIRPGALSPHHMRISVVRV